MEGRQGRELRHDSTSGTRKACQHLQNAGLAAQAGEWRRCADEYIAATTTAPRRWEHRWYAFSGFASLVVQEKRFTPTKQDMRALARVAKDEDEPVHFRTEAEFVIGLARWDARDRDGAGRHYRRCIALGSVASPAERAVREWASGHDERGAPAIVKKAAGDLMDYTVQSARDNLRVLESPVGARPAEYAAKGPWLRADGSEIPNELRSTGVPLGWRRDGCRACTPPRAGRLDMRPLR